MTGERVVWKYPFPPGESRLELSLPVGSRIVLFAAQGSTLTVWVERPADPGEARPRELRTLRIYGSGHLIPDGDWLHRGSALVADGEFVFHLYELSAP